jgi:hypothetical protein
VLKGEDEGDDDEESKVKETLIQKYGSQLMEMNIQNLLA